MDTYFQKQLSANSLNYKRSLDRIIDKYSNLQYQDDSTHSRELDLNHTDTSTIQRYMEQARVELNKLESQSLTDLRDESLRVQDVTRDPLLDLTNQDGGINETCVSSSQLSVEDDGMARSDVTQLTVSSLGESQTSFCSTELQPEDDDEELEMSLRSHGKSLVELYPSMISRIGRAWHRQHVTEAADLVVRRYRRWRQQSNRSYMNNTFIVTMRHSNPKEKNSKTLLKDMTNSPVKIQFTGTGATPRSPMQMFNSPQDWKAQQLSPGRVRGLARSEQHQPILVMDLSGSFEASKPKGISLNETFNISQREERSSSYAVSPPRPSNPTPQIYLDLALRHKRLSLAAHSPQTDRCSAYALQPTAVAERPDISCSPLRQSPLKTRMMSSLSGSPRSFSRSPKAHSVELFSKEPTRPRSMSTSLPSPPQKPSVPQRMLYAHDSHHSFRSQLPSPLSGKAAGGHHRLRRHLSFDSYVPLARVSVSPKKLDEDFMKLYHKFVCQSKSSVFNGLPCRYCLRGSEASRGHSSSALAALALSPHRSLFRKRQRELSWDSHPQSKRSREDYCKSSPGSKRHGNEMQRHHLSLSECEHYGLSYSPSKPSMFQRLITQQRSADKHQDSWMSQGRDMSGFQLSGLGLPLQ